MNQQHQQQQQQQQQQHLMQMQPMMAAYYPNTVTSDHIQQYLDENKSLILKIVESQNSGKLAECAENQARLQKNLMYLAAIADSQPQPPSMHSQFNTSGMMQSTSPYMQQQHQQPYSTTRSSIVYNSPQPYASLQQQYQALNSHQLGMNSSGASGGLHMMMHGEATSSVVTTPVSYSHDFGRIDQSTANAAGTGGGVTKHEHWSGGGGETSGGNSRCGGGGGGDGMFMNNSDGGCGGDDDN